MDIVELLAERNIHVDPSSVFDWVRRFTPLYKEAARPHRHRGACWAVDETYIRLAGRWVYAYRAIDEHGHVIDVYLSETCDTAADTAFFEQAIARTDARPQRVTMDKAAAYPPTLRAVVPEAEHITGKAEQQGLERDHQQLKGRTRSMQGFQKLRCAQVVCDGYGFMRNPRRLLPLGRTHRRSSHPARSTFRPRLGRSDYSSGCSIAISRDRTRARPRTSTSVRSSTRPNGTLRPSSTQHATKPGPFFIDGSVITLSENVAGRELSPQRCNNRDKPVRHGDEEKG